MKFKDIILTEGINDPGIFKAIFLAGGPGSGKTYVAKQLFGIPDNINVSQYGLKMLGSDTELEFLLKKYFDTVDMDKMPVELFRQLTDPSYDDYSGLRTRAKELTASRLKGYIKGRLGVVIDGTGHNYNNIKKQYDELQKYGYDCYMVFVNTSLEIAIKRNNTRERKLPKDIVVTSWNDTQANIKNFEKLFGKSNIIIVDNNDYLNPVDAQKKFNKIINSGILKFLKKSVKNNIAKDWMEKQKLIKKHIKEYKMKEKELQLRKIIREEIQRLMEYEKVKTEIPPKDISKSLIAKAEKNFKETINNFKNKENEEYWDFYKKIKKDVFLDIETGVEVKLKDMKHMIRLTKFKKVPIPGVKLFYWVSTSDSPNHRENSLFDSFSDTEPDNIFQYWKP